MEPREKRDRIGRRFVLLVAPTILSGLAYATETFPPPYTYTSTYSQLTYRYNVNAGDPATLVRSFSAVTSQGELRGTITYSPSRTPFSVSIWIKDTSPTVTLAASTQVQNGYASLTMDFGSLGVMSYTVREDPPEITAAGSTVSDCDALGALPVMRALSEFGDRVLDDVAVQQAVAEHEHAMANILATLYVSGRIVEDCRAQLYHPLWCQIEDTYEGCAQCCEDNTLVDKACKGAAIICVWVIKNPICQGISSGCMGLVV